MTRLPFSQLKPTSTSAEGSVEREVARPQSQHDVVALEESLEEGLQRPFEMAHMDGLVDDEASIWWNIGVCVASLSER